MSASPAYLPTLNAPVAPTPPVTGTRAFWSPQELQVLRERYLTGGSRACLPLLPGRSRTAISEQARKLGLRTNKPYRPAQQSSEWLDAEIRRFYAQKRTGRGALKTFCRRIGRSRHWVYTRARALGAIVESRKPPRWLPEETAILEAHEGLGLRQMQRRLAAAGFTRTLNAIACQCTRHGIQRVEDDPDSYSANTLADIMGVDAKVVTRWVEAGKLRATKTGAGRAPYKIARKDIRRFLIANLGAWDHQRIPQWWLVELLANVTTFEGRA